MELKVSNNVIFTGGYYMKKTCKKPICQLKQQPKIDKLYKHYVRKQYEAARERQEAMQAMARLMEFMRLFGF